MLYHWTDEKMKHMDVNFFSQSSQELHNKTFIQSRCRSQFRSSRSYYSNKFIGRENEVHLRKRPRSSLSLSLSLARP